MVTVGKDFDNGKIVIVGRGGSGKDFLRKKFEERGFKYCVSYTSRPIRSGESEGKDYRFTDLEYFTENESKFYEIDEFNGWKYGTLVTDFHRSNLFIMTPRGVNNIRPEDRKRCFVIFIDPPKDIIKKRLTERKDADSADRRIEADDKDFFEFFNYDMRVTNHDF
jgi:guanylate kinase